MTIDERLEALTQSEELLASLHRDNEAAIKAMTAGIDQIRQLVLIHEMRIKDLETGP